MALLDIWTFRLGEEDKSLLYPDIKEDLSSEEVKRLEMMARYNKSRHIEYIQKSNTNEQYKIIF